MTGQPKKEKFLAAYAACGCISEAARIAGCARQVHYLWLEEDPDYPERFEQAKEAAADALELEARRRAMEGVRRLKFGRDGDPLIDPETGQPYEERAFSDTLMIVLLKATRPEKYADRQVITGNLEHKHVGVMFDGDFYSTAARMRAAYTDAASGDDPDAPGEGQGSGVRKAVGKNGNGAAGRSAGPRA